MEEIRNEVLKWVLTNAVEHNGKADAKSVMGKLIAELPGWKSKIGELSLIVKEVVDEVNSMSSEEQNFQLKKVGAPKKAEHAEKKGLQELPELDRFPLVVTRFAPNPNGPLHLGNARAAILSHEYARKYKGKFILRFEDTNPEKVLLEMYEFIKRDLRWLGMSWDEEYAQSDRIEKYYTCAEQLLGEGKAYVCTCDVEKFRLMRDAGEPCPCRDKSTEENLAGWSKMLSGDVEQGAAVVRIKTDLRHPNPAVRDWPALRVVKTPHPKTGEKFKIWPLYNFSVSIDDHEMGVSHVFRGKEHEGNEQCQRTLFMHLGWDYPVAIQYGRLAIPGAPLSKTQTIQAISGGKLTGFDDVRLATLTALKRRGILPETVRQVILGVGLTLVDSSLSWETLYAQNRKMVDEIASRYFFVQNPVKLMVKNAPDLKEVSLRAHPSRPEAGERILPLERDNGGMGFYISREDCDKIQENGTFRLKDLMNVKMVKKGKVCEAEFESLGIINVPKIHWVSKGALQVEVLTPENEAVKGLAEPAVASLEPGAIVQFERYGFVRIESISPKILAAYSHR